MLGPSQVWRDVGRMEEDEEVSFFKGMGLGCIDLLLFFVSFFFGGAEGGEVEEEGGGVGPEGSFYFIFFFSVLARSSLRSLLNWVVRIYILFFYKVFISPVGFFFFFFQEKK